MPAINTGRLFIPSLNIASVVSTTQNMSATTDIVAIICQVPQTGTLTGFKFNTGTVTTGCTVIGTMETVTAAKPSTTLYHANATGTVVVANTDDNVTKTVAFAGNVSVTKGDIVALKVAVSSGTPSSMGIKTQASGFTSTMPMLYTNLSTVDAWGTNAPCFLFTYDTGDLAPMNTIPATTNANISISSSTTPDEVGILFTAPFSAKTDGYCFRTAGANNAQDIDVVLYDSSNNVLASHSLTGTSISGSGINNFIQGAWTTDTNILRGRQYRLILKPTTTTTWTNLISQVTTYTTLDWDGSASISYTSRTDAGAWTDVSTAVAPLCLSISQVYQPGGSYF